MSIRAVALFLVSVTVIAPAFGQDQKKGLAELQGIWKLAVRETEEGIEDAPANLPYWVIKGDKVLYAGETLAILTIDAGTVPKSADLKFVGKDRTYEAAYAIEGDTLKICVNRRTDGVKERPTDFTTADNPDRRLLVFRRQKADAGDGTKNAAAFVGVQIGKTADDKGVVVAAALPKSPAEKAGLKKDDVILRVGANDVTGVRQCVDLVRAARPGAEVTLRIRRGEKEQDITLRPAVLPFMLLE